jgi:23S rRNA G2069 N7-methylase RlmK/C1962 C5-methylase RlmI
MKKLIPLAVLIALAVAGWLYAKAKMAEKTANRDAVRAHCHEVCGDWDECVDRIIDRFDDCFTLAYRQAPLLGGDALIAERFASCMNTRDFAERGVFDIVPGEVPFPAR